MPNTNFQTIHQMDGVINSFVKQATGRDAVQNIDMEHITVAQNHYYEDVDISGRVVSFNAGAAGIPLKKCLVQIEPVQDLHGYDHPWPAGGGKNLCALNDFTTTKKGVAFAYTNGKLIIDGTPQSTGWFGIGERFKLPAGTYTISYKVSGNNPVVKIGFDNFGGYIYFSTAGTLQRTFTLSEETTGILDLSCDQTTAYANTEVLIQIESGSTATAWSPYSNICPISGWTKAKVFVSPTTDEADGTTYIIAFPSEAGTVYGGTLDVTTGELVVDKFLYVYDGTEGFNKSSAASNGFYNNLLNTAPPHNWPNISNYTTLSISDERSSMFIPTRNSDTYKNNTGYIYLDTGHNFNAPPETFGTTVESFKAKLAELYTAGTPVSVFCKIKTPITYHFTPQEARTLLGQNNIWADTGDIEVKFKNTKEFF